MYISIIWYGQVSAASFALLRGKERQAKQTKIEFKPCQQNNQLKGWKGNRANQLFWLKHVLIYFRQEILNWQLPIN
jgi:hypothetical protein